jgi:hypothetical protein
MREQRAFEFSWPSTPSQNINALIEQGWRVLQVMDFRGVFLVVLCEKGPRVEGSGGGPYRQPLEPKP